MATLTRGQTLGSTETVTNTKLHNLVDFGTIAGIENADIASDAAIADTKLDDITTGNKVSGKSLFNLASTPSASGLIPGINLNGLSLASIPVSGLDYTRIGVSLASIPSGAVASLNAIKLANLASIPVSQQVPYNLLVSSLASGSLPQYNGTSNFVGRAPSTIGGLTLISATAMASTNSGDITIEAEKIYKLVVDVVPTSTGGFLSLRVNSDGSTNYNSIAANGGTEIELIAASTTVNSTSSRYIGEFIINTRVLTTTKRFAISGQSFSENGSDLMVSYDVGGEWIKNEAIASFEIVGGQSFTGTIYLYEMLLS